MRQHGLPAGEQVSRDAGMSERTGRAVPVELRVVSMAAMLPRVQRLAGNAAASWLVAQRLMAQRQNAPTGHSFVLDGQAVATNGDLAGWYTTRIANVEAESGKLAGEEVAAPPSVARLATSTQAEISRLRRDSSAALNDDTLERAAEWLDSYESAYTDIDTARTRAAAAKLNEAAATINKSDGQLSTVTDQLRDRQRQAMLANDSKSILATTDMMQTVLDTALVLKQSVLDIRKLNVEILAEELKWLGKGTPPSAKWIPGVLDIATKIDKVYAVFTLARAGYAMAMGGATEAEEGRTAISAMSTVVGAGFTLMNASAGLTVYANLYIGPMVNRCLEMIAKLEGMIAAQNLSCMKEGMWDLVVWRVEPGGRHLFDFMCQVMAASGSEAIPNPPDTVAKLMLNRQDALKAGTREEVPTKGMWFWEKLDAAKVKRWLFAHRLEVWAMFYGSAPVPR